jgi:tRNA threonylcarbamoyladenosine biosynthesis protein TsaB
MSRDLILAFDTSAAHCAAALLSGSSVIAERIEPMQKGQAERLFPLLEEMLADAGASWRDLEVLGVGIGPGNFTGVRISVAAARGLALSLGIPAVGVSTLQAMVHGFPGVALASLDARRDEIYVQVFDGLGQPPVLCDLAHLPEVPARAEPLCIGYRAAEIAGLCGGKVGEALFPLPVAMARIAGMRRHSAGRPAPLYLRSADAAPSSDPPPVILP